MAGGVHGRTIHGRGDMHGSEGMCGRGHVWQGARVAEGACMVGMCMAGRHAWQERRPLQRNLFCGIYSSFSAPWVTCQNSPCDNGATCVDVNVDTFICVCRDGYFGVDCSDS